MNQPSDKLASWASILGSVVALLGLLQSQLWITVCGIAVTAGAVGAVFYARRHQRVLHLAGISIEGLNLDSLNIANLRRRRNRSLVVQRAYHFAKIEGPNLSVSWQYEGFCRVERETSMEFSIDTENNIDFDQLECFAFDLQEDPNRTHRIRPMLIGQDGISKKIRVPFLTPLASEQPFAIALNCILPGCIGNGVHYYTSSLSFEQRTIARLAVHLVFVRRPPKWVRAYECESGKAVLAYELRPVSDGTDFCEYIDEVENTSGDSLRVYLYDLGSSNEPEVVRASFLSSAPALGPGNGNRSPRLFPPNSNFAGPP